MAKKKKSNKEIVQKMVIASDELAAAGRLNPEQASRFIDFVIDETQLKNIARIKRVRDRWEANKIGVGRRVAVPKAEASAPRVRRGVTTSKIQLSPKKIMVPFEITDEFADINVEKEDVKDHVVKMMAKQAGNNLEELIILGNLVGPAVVEDDILEGGSTTEYVLDSYMALLDGFLKQAENAQVVNALGTKINALMFNDAIKAMPTKFRKQMNDLRFFMASNSILDWRMKVSTRQSGEGDAALAGEQPTKPFGVSPVAIPLMPHDPQNVQHIVLNGTTATSLDFAPIEAGSVAITTTTIQSQVPEAAFIETTDYVVDYTNGTIARTGGSAITDGGTVKVTFNSYSKFLLTHRSNFLVALGLKDIIIEKDRDIYKGVDQWAITLEVDATFEEEEAVVMVTNVQPGV